MNIAFISFVFLVSCVHGKERTFTGSTPADPVVRSFLAISLSDSVDFIRWNLVIRDNLYELQCNYGIGKPNTNGFINGGQRTGIKGELVKEKNFFQLKNGNRVLKLIELNTDLLHILNENNSLLTGGGGWSYTLSNVTPTGTDLIFIKSQQTVLKDSMVFIGRTPCHIPGLIPAGRECYKLKWHLVLYALPGMNGTGTYKVFGTLWRKENGQAGIWKIITAKNGNILYRLNNEKGDGFLYLIQPGEQIILFTDATGKLLVGDMDFSYTLNRASR